jgi:hypothetical protein
MTRPTKEQIANWKRRRKAKREVRSAEKAARKAAVEAKEAELLAAEGGE